MIYQALVELAKQENLLEDTSYEPLPVHYLLVLDDEGRLLDVLGPRDPAPLDAKGRPKGKPAPSKRPIPRRSDRTSQDQAEFLVDKAEYVFGIDPEDKKRPKKLAEHRRLFRESTEEARRAIPGSAGLRAVAAFLSEDPPPRIRDLLAAESDADRRALAGALFAFVYQPDGGIRCVHDEPEVREHFRQRLNSGDFVVGQCLVTGEQDVALTTLHARPKGIPPKGKTKGGVPLTSVNAPAFVSYGLDQVGGAPISRTASVAIELALNRLLDSAYPKPGGGTFPTRNLHISPDTAVVYWAREEAGLDFVAGIESRDPEEVAELLRSPYRGGRAPIEDPSDFHALVLSGTTGRAIVRSYLHSTVKEIAWAVERYREEARIVRPFQEGPGGYPLGDLRRALVPRGDLDHLPPALGASLHLDVLAGRPFPRAILDSAVRRNRAHDLHENKDRRDFRRLGPRCSLLKAYFNRNGKEGISVSLDGQRKDAPYRLGRLLAAVDKVQQEALGSINATLIDRYYGAASSTPAAVFPTLVRRFQHHLSKLRRDRPGLAVVRERLAQEILGDIRDFPTTLNLEAQGLFALGFYHQRQDFFSKKEEE